MLFHVLNCLFSERRNVKEAKFCCWLHQQKTEMSFDKEIHTLICRLSFITLWQYFNRKLTPIEKKFQNNFYDGTMFVLIASVQLNIGTRSR